MPSPGDGGDASTSLVTGMVMVMGVRGDGHGDGGGDRGGDGDGDENGEAFLWGFDIVSTRATTFVRALYRYN